MNRRRARRVRNFIFAVFLLSLFGALLWGAFLSPFFVIERVEIEGAKFIPEEEIRDSVYLWLSSKGRLVLPKRHVLFYDPKGLGAMLSEKFIRIGELDIKPEFRSRTLRIRIAEREPIGFWCVYGIPECYVFDIHGVIFERIVEPVGNAALMVRDTTGKEIVPGRQALPSDWVEFFQILRIELQPDLWIQEFIIEPETFDAGYIRARMSAGWDFFVNVEVGKAKDTAEMLRALLFKEILGNAKRLEYIDMRVSGRAYYKLR